MVQLDHVGLLENFGADVRQRRDAVNRTLCSALDAAFCDHIGIFSLQRSASGAQHINASQSVTLPQI
tara:strand:+ start:563 stop:763 length:201 start_codon:yes stop_codon:yes gene_type:complete